MFFCFLVIDPFPFVKAGRLSPYFGYVGFIFNSIVCIFFVACFAKSILCFFIGYMTFFI